MSYNKLHIKHYNAKLLHRHQKSEGQIWNHIDIRFRLCKSTFQLCRIIGTCVFIRKIIAYI